MVGAAKALLKLGATVGINGRTAESVNATIAELVKSEEGVDASKLYAAPGDVSTMEGRTAI